MFIADETGNLFPHQLFGLRGQEVTEKSSEKEGTKTIVFLCVEFSITHSRAGLSHGEEEEGGRGERRGRGG